MDKDAKDLIERLLVLDPKQRLGASKEGEFSIQELKKHPFFSKVDFKKIHKRIPPIHQQKVGYKIKNFIRKFDDVYNYHEDVSINSFLNFIRALRMKILSKPQIKRRS